MRGTPERSWHEARALRLHCSRRGQILRRGYLSQLTYFRNPCENVDGTRLVTFRPLMGRSSPGKLHQQTPIILDGGYLSRQMFIEISRSCTEGVFRQYTAQSRSAQCSATPEAVLKTHMLMPCGLHYTSHLDLCLTFVQFPEHMTF